MRTPLKSHPLRLWRLSPAKAFRQANIGNGLWRRPTHTWILLELFQYPFLYIGCLHMKQISMICWKPRILWSVQTCTDTWNGLGTRTEWATTVHHLNPFVILLRDSTDFDPLVRKGVEVHVTLERILHQVTDWGGQRRPNSTWKPGGPLREAKCSPKSDAKIKPWEIYGRKSLKETSGWNTQLS